MAVMLSFCPPGKAAASTPATDPQAAVMSLIQRFVEGQRTYNPEAIRDVTAENYIEVSPRGEVDKREAVLGFYDPKQKANVPSASVTDTNIRVMGDTAIAIVAIKYVIAPDGNSREIAMRATFVAMRLQDTWKLVSAQYSPLVPHEQPH